jgi:hypothetical protein
VNPAGGRADRRDVPYKTEGPYFVNLDAPAPLSRTTAVARDQRYASDGGRTPVPPHKRRKRSIRVRPAWIFVLLAASWLGWAYSTPGGPSARIRGWIDHTRGVVAEASVNPDVRRSAAYFNNLYATQGSYPNLSDTAIQTSPGFGLSETLVYCGPRAIVLQSLSSGGSLSRLLLAGKDLGNVPGTHGCPSNLAHPAPWTLAKQ